MKNTIKILAILVSLILISIIVLILFSPYFLSAYKDEITGYLGKTLNRKVEVKKVSLTVWTGLGLSVEGFKIHNPSSFKNDLFLDIDSLNLSIEFWPLLRQRIVSQGILVKNPRLFLETNTKGISNLETLGGPEDAKSPEASSAKPEILPGIRISKLQMSNGSISNENSLTKDVIALNGIDIDLSKMDYMPEPNQKKTTEGINVEGGIKINRGKINRFQFEQLAGQMILEKMTLHLMNWNLKAYGGTLEGDLRLQLNEKLPRYQLSGKTNKINLQRLISENTSIQNVIEGDFYSNISAKGAGLTLADLENNLSGKGEFSLQRGALKTVNLIKQVSLLSKFSLLQQNVRAEETDIESLKGVFTIDHGKILFQSLRGSIPEGEITGNGSVDFHKVADLKIKIILSKNETEKLPQEARPFLTGENNQAVFPVTLKGDITSPSVHLETTEIKQKAVKEGIKQGIKSLLDRLNN